jgi:hypothetical protein
MKALIIYDSMASALKTSDFLRNATRVAGIGVDWEINIWPISMLRIRSVAEEALKDGVDADLVVFAGCRTDSLCPWLKEWLERWAAQRLVKYAALALIDDKSPWPSGPPKASELWDFAEGHNLDFIVSNDCDPENEYAYSMDATR